MDQKAREERRRRKANATPRGELSNFEPRGLGRKNRRHETFPQGRCEYDTAPLSFYKKPDPAKPGEYKIAAFRKNSNRCPKNATVRLANGKRSCNEHIALLKATDEL